MEQLFNQTYCKQCKRDTINLTFIDKSSSDILEEICGKCGKSKIDD